MNNDSENKIIADGDAGALSAEEETLIDSFKKLEKKHLFYQRVSAILIAILVIALLSVLPSVFKTLSIAEQTLNNANEAMINANEAILQAQSTLSDVSDFVVTSGEDMSKAMNNLNSIDFAGLNNAIADLESVVEPMSKLFGKR